MHISNGRQGEMSQDQLQLFRETIQRLDPTQPIRAPAQHSWYVERPESTATGLARTLQLVPSSSHLVVGSIGCGKSTELLAAGRILSRSPGVFARYVEVSRVQDLAVATSEAIAVAVADELVEYLSKGAGDDAELGQLRAVLKPLVQGGYDPNWDAPDFDDGGGFEGKVTRPRPVPEAMVKISPILNTLRDIVGRRYKSELVWLLDGLDRLSDPIQFDKLVEPFLRVLQTVGIGVAATGPWRSILGVHRTRAASFFDEIHWVGPVDPAPDGPGRSFLEKVMKVRQVERIVPTTHQRELIRWSGGAIRLLLQITREAIKEAWLRNVAVVGAVQVTAAADKVGRSLLLGLSDAEMDRLETVLAQGSFAQRSPEDAALLLTNRVLEYRAETGLARYRVHPTLVPFLKTETAPVANLD